MFLYLILLIYLIFIRYSGVMYVLIIVMLIVVDDFFNDFGSLGDEVEDQENDGLV